MDNKDLLEGKKEQIITTYNHELGSRNNENRFTYIPEVEIDKNNIIVKLKDEPEKHANFINMYAAQDAWGSDNRDIIYDIGGKKHSYDFSMLGGVTFTPIDENPYTQDLPIGNQLLKKDFE